MLMGAIAWIPLILLWLILQRLDAQMTPKVEVTPPTPSPLYGIPPHVAYYASICCPYGSSKYPLDLH